MRVHLPVPMLILALLLPACASLQATDLVSVGRGEAFPLYSVTRFDLQAVFLDPDPPAIGSETPGVVTQPTSETVSPVPVFLIHSEEGEFLALYARDPFLGCQIRWDEEERFRDPCHGSLYGRNGEWLSGPSDRGMDRFEVVVDAQGELAIDLSGFQFGGSHP
jgi:nitrite reductase/ring-hydroxylating ferredoxin subunit